MPRFSSHSPSPAMVVACFALIVALSGTSYAAFRLPANSVGTRQLRNKAVTPAKVAARTIALFKGQKGDKGDRGPQGTQGATGATGPIGPSNAYFNSSTDTQASVSVPAGDYVVFVTGDFADTGVGNDTDYCVATGPSGNLSGLASISVPAGGSGVASVEAVAHLTSAGTIADNCIYDAGGKINSNSVTAVRVGSATP